MTSRTRSRAQLTNINIVSLLDIFTILLLFLLVQAGDPEESLPVLADVKLPWSEATQAPKRTLVVSVDQHAIRVEGQFVVLLSDVQASDRLDIPALAESLRVYLKQAAASADAGDQFSGKVTVMADREIPFSILKRVMFTCAGQRFGDIALAVQQEERAS